MDYPLMRTPTHRPNRNRDVPGFAAAALIAVFWLKKRAPFLGPFSCGVVWVRRCPTLPHPPGCSTIGAGGLSFRVRNGTGRVPTAVATGPQLSTTPATPARPRSGVGGWWGGVLGIA